MDAPSPWPIQTRTSLALVAVAQEKEENLLKSQVAPGYQKKDLLGNVKKEPTKIL